MENTALPFLNAGEAIGVIESGMQYLADLDCSELPAQVKADTLKGLERADALETVARAHLVWSFDKNSDYETYGQRSMRAWLVNEARLTRGEAGSVQTWTRRVLEHPAIAGLMADGLITRSWLAKITLITGKIREDRRGEAEQLIAELAREGQLGPRDLFRLAAEIRDRAPAEDPRDDDPDRGFEDRSLRLEVTIGGAGTLIGQLSPECAAAVGSLVRRFAAKRGTQDTRTQPQRNHDALLELCLRLLGTDQSAPTPGGAPVQMTVTTSLCDLYALDDGSALQQTWIDRAAAWFAGQHAADPPCRPAARRRAVPVARRLRPARLQLPAAPPGPARPPRPHQPGQPQDILHLPPPHRHPPVGLAHQGTRRRHRHRPVTGRHHRPRPPAPARVATPGTRHDTHQHRTTAGHHAPRRSGAAPRPAARG